MSVLRNNFIIYLLEHGADYRHQSIFLLLLSHRAAITPIHKLADIGDQFSRQAD